MKRAKILLKVVAPPGGYADRLVSCLADYGYEVVSSKYQASSGVVEAEVLAPYGETDERRSVVPRQ